MRTSLILLSIFALIAIRGQNPILAWTKSQLDNSWKAGTEVSDPLTPVQLSTLLQELVKNSVLIV